MREDALLTANAIPTEAGNRLRLTFWNASTETAFLVACRYQILNKDGSISQNYAQFTIPVSSIALPFLLTLAPGHLLSVTLTTIGTTLQNGELYATIALQYGDVTTESQQLPLSAGYVLNYAPLNYPLSDVAAINSGLPASVDVAIGDPGPGLEIDYTEAASSRSRLTALSFNFVTDATIGVRQVHIVYTNATATWIKAKAASTQNASETRTYQLWIGTTPPTAPTGYIYIPLPSLPPLQTLQIVTQTDNIQGADEFSTVRANFARRVAM